MAKPRQYVVPLTGVVTVDARNGTVEIEVDLVDLAHDLKYDYDHEYPDDQTKWDEEVIQRHLNESLEHHYLRHTMGK